MAADLDVVIVTYNSAEHLPAALEALADRPVVVVDNASTDGTVALVRERHPEVTVIANPVNRGFAVAVNQGLAAGDGRAALLLNPDARVTSEVLSRLLAFLDAADRVAACAPLIDEGGGQLNARPFPAITLRLVPATRARPHDRPLDLPGEWGRAVGVHWLTGACLLLRRAALDDVGPLDEGYFLYAEDIDWCYRAFRRGWEVALLPDLSAHHAGRGSSRQVASRLTHQRNYDSYFRFLTRAHGGLVARAVYLWWLLNCGLRLAAGRRDEVLRERFRFCLDHLGRPFVLARFGRNHASEE